jgi:hypothetical protein
MATNNAINYDKIVPTFFSYVALDVNNVTGDGTVYDCIFGALNFNINLNYDVATGLFTVTRPGQYFFGTNIAVRNTTGLSSIEVLLVTTPGTYQLSKFNCTTMTTSADVMTVSGYSEVKLSAGETAKIQLVVSGGGKVVDLLGQSGFSQRSNFYGYLMCPA